MLIYPGNETYHYLIMIRHKAHVRFTEVTKANAWLSQDSIDFRKAIRIDNLEPGYEVVIELYCMVKVLLLLVFYKIYETVAQICAL